MRIIVLDISGNKERERIMRDRWARLIRNSRVNSGYDVRDSVRSPVRKAILVLASMAVILIALDVWLG